MGDKKVSGFFKKLFRREAKATEASKRWCYECETALVPESMGPRLLERCPECRGIWLSQSQLHEILDQITHKAESEDAETVESDGHAEIAHTFAPSRLKRKCPECGEEMDNYKFEGTGIWIDGCPHGHGIWLDNGELRLIAQRLNAEETETPGTVLDAVSDLILGSL